MQSIMKAREQQYTLETSLEESDAITRINKWLESESRLVKEHLIEAEKDLETTIENSPKECEPVSCALLGSKYRNIAVEKARIQDLNMVIAAMNQYINNNNNNNNKTKG